MSPLRTRAIAACGALALATGSLLAGSVTAHAAVGDVTEYSLAPSTSPYDVAVGPDGNLWVTNTGSGTISKVTTAGVVTTYTIPTPGSGPRSIAAGPDNALWFTENVANKIGRLAVDGTFTEYAIPTAASEPVGIALGTDNALWFTEYAGNKIGRITTAGAITEFPLPTPGSGPYDIVAGIPASERLYFTQLTGARIGTVSTVGNVVDGAVLPAGSSPMGITIINGVVWFVEYTTSSLDRLVNDATASRIALAPGAGPTFVTGGPGNSIWVSMTGADQVWRFTDQGAVNGQYPLTTPASDPAGLAAGPDGNIWVAQFAPSKVAKVAGGQVPVSSAAPAITPLTGVAPGTVLTATTGTWSSSPASYAYQWQMCPSGAASCTNVPAATAATYTVAAGDNLKSLRVGVTAVNISGSSTIAYSSLVSVGTPTPTPNPTPAPATGTMASIGSGATAELQAPATQKRGKSKTYSVVFTAANAQGTVNLVFTASGKRKTVNGLPVATGLARYTWKMPKSWKKGRTTVNATFVPAPGTVYSGANMVARVKVS